MSEILREAKPILILLAVCAVLIGAVVWIMDGGLTSTIDNISTKKQNSDIELSAPLTVDKLAAYDVDIINDMNPVAVMQTNKGTIEIELFEDRMPITSGNFVKLAEQGFYDGTKFHRVISDFMIQGGDPNTKTDDVMSYGTGGPGYSIPDEHIKGDLLTNNRGTISMANSGPQSGGSQFFINLKDNSFLDFDKEPLQLKHPVFGRVVTGMDIVDSIALVETNPADMPLEDVVIESVTIRRN